MKSDLVLDDINQVISDPKILSQGYIVRNGFVFKALNMPYNIFNAIVIRVPFDARYFGDALPISARTLDEHIACINENDIESVILIADDLCFLDKLPIIKHLSVTPSINAIDDFDFSPLYELNYILSLRCQTNYGKYDEKKANMDYSKMKGLQYLCVKTPNDLNYENILTLLSLSITNGKSVDLKRMFSSTNLDSLNLTSCKIRSLSGIERAPKMQCLYLRYNRCLQDISSLFYVKDTLKALYIDRCSKICDYSVLSEMTNLEYLYLNGSNSIPNLSFLKQMPNLKTLICGLKVDDGDLSQCLNLSYAYFGKMRNHYNLKMQDLPHGEFFRGNDNIEPWRRLH